MPKQPQLFDDPTAREPTTETIQQPKRLGWKATPAPIGSGPPGETCKTCTSAVKLDSPSGKSWYKCSVMRWRWTGGTATDIKLKWEACKSWEPKEIAKRIRSLGQFASDVLDGSGWSASSLLVIADHYEELGDGQDMGWLRHVANRMEEA